jgi:hypothetical protein
MDATCRRSGLSGVDGGLREAVEHPIAVLAAGVAGVPTRGRRRAAGTGAAAQPGAGRSETRKIVDDFKPLAPGPKKKKPAACTQPASVDELRQKILDGARTEKDKLQAEREAAKVALHGKVAGDADALDAAGMKLAWGVPPKTSPSSRPFLDGRIVETSSSSIARARRASRATSARASAMSSTAASRSSTVNARRKTDEESTVDARRSRALVRP